MKVVFLIPAGQTESGEPELATVEGRLLVAVTPEELDQVPESWVALDVDRTSMITVTEWMREAGA